MAYSQHQALCFQVGCDCDHSSFALGTGTDLYGLGVNQDLDALFTYTFLNKIQKW